MLSLIFLVLTMTNNLSYANDTTLSISIEHYNELCKINSIGVIRSAHSNEKFDQDNLLNKVSVNSYIQAIRLLKLDRISRVVGSRIGLEYALRQQNMDEALITNVFKLTDKEWGLHLSKKSPFMAKLAL